MAVALAAQAAPAVSQTSDILLDAEPVETEAAPASPRSSGATDAALEAAREADRAAARAARAVAGGAARAQPQAAAAPRSFVLRDIRFTPSAYLDAASLQAAEAALVGRRFSLSDLTPLLDAVARLYAERDIALAQPLIRAVDPRAGIVDVELFEARLGAVRFRSSNARPAYYRWRLGAAPGDLADTRLLDARLTRLTLTDGVTFDAQFTPGAARGQTDMVVEVREPARWSGEIAADNYGTESRGAERLSATLRATSLTGWNDPFALSLSGGQHALSVSASYGRVIHPSGLSMALTLGIDRSETADRPRLETRARFGEVSLSYPVLVEERRRLTASAALHAFSERSELAGVRTLDQEGGYLSLALSGAWFWDRASLVASQAVRIVTYDDAVAGTRGTRAVTLPGDATLAYRVTDATTLSLRAGWQIARRAPAPSRLEFTAASPFAVRGYPTGLQAGDAGWFLRAQIEHSVASRALPPGASLTPFVFLDVGEAYDFDGRTHTGQGRLAAAGVGISSVWQDRFFADAFVAKPLNDVPGFSADGEWSVFARVGVRF
jgi:hemolysin activation/secretion protein